MDKSTEFGAFMCYSAKLFVQRKPFADFQHFRFHGRNGGLAFLDDSGDQVADLPHLRFLHTARGCGGSAEAHAARLELVARVKRNRIAVCRCRYGNPERIAIGIHPARAMKRTILPYRCIGSPFPTGDIL